MISLILLKMGKHTTFSSQVLFNGRLMTEFYCCYKTDKTVKSLYGFGEGYLNIRDFTRVTAAASFFEKKTSKLLVAHTVS